MAELLTGSSISYKFIPNMRKTLVEGLLNNGVSAFGKMRSFTLEALETTAQDDVVYKLSDEEQALDAQNKPIKKIPVHFVDPLKDRLTKAEEEEIKASITAEPGSAEYNAIFNAKKLDLAKRKFNEDSKSYDLSYLLMKMAESVYSYKHTKQVEAAAQLLLATAKTDKVSTTLEKNKNPYIDEWRGRLKFHLGISSEEISALERSINLYIYKQRIQNDTTFTIGGKEYSTAKAVTSFINSATIATLGFSPITAAAAGIQNAINARLLAVEGRYYDKQAWKKGNKLKKQNPKVYHALQELLGVSNIGYYHETSMQFAANKMKKIISGDTTMTMVKGADDSADRATLAALVHSWG